MDFFIWRPILEGKVTLKELETHYSLQDLLLLNEAMSQDYDMQEHEMKRQEKEMKRRTKT